MNRTLAILVLMIALSAPALGDSLSLKTETGILFGTLEVPGGEGKHPVVLMQPGSGPTDGDGNIMGAPGKNNSLKYVAEGLRARGIASLRIDKRGVRRSMAAATVESELRFDHYINDAKGWLELLRSDGRFSRIVMLGHSEGSLIGMIAAREAGADAFVSLAGPGFPADEILAKQLRPSLPPELYDRSLQIMKELKQGRTVDDVPQAFYTLFRPSVQPYLISWFKRDPRAEIKRLEVPVLIVQGDTDIQVGPDDAKSLASARSGSELELMQGMNHVLKQVPHDRSLQLASYYDPELPVSDSLIDRLARFITASND